MSEDARILVGAIAGAFGVKGEVKLKSFCAEPRAIASYGPLWSEDGARSFTLALTRPVPAGFAARIPGIATREQAEALRGTRLYAARSRLPALPDDEFYHADLIGLEVLDTGGAPLGRVAAVLNHGAGDILEIRPGHGAGAHGPDTHGRALLLPFTRACVPTVDLGAGRLIADPPPEAPGGTAPQPPAGTSGDATAD